MVDSEVEAAAASFSTAGPKMEGLRPVNDARGSMPLCSEWDRKAWLGRRRSVRDEDVPGSISTSRGKSHDDMLDEFEREKEETKSSSSISSIASSASAGVTNRKSAAYHEQ